MSSLDLGVDDMKRFVDSAPCPILVLDLSGLWDAVEVLRAQGVVDLDSHGAVEPAILAALPDQIRGVMINPRARAIVGGTHDGDALVLVRRFLRRPATENLLRAVLMGVWRGEPVLEQTGSVQARDGRTMIVTMTMTLPTTRHASHRVAVHLADCTEAARQEAALQDSEARFRQAFDNAGHGMVLVAADGRVLNANRMFADMLGMPIEVLQDIVLDDLTPPTERLKEQALRRRMIEGDGEAYAVETRFRDINGAPVQVRASVALMRDQAGASPYFLYQILNVTGHYQALARAQAAESQLMGAIETIKDGFLLFDESERLVLVNSHARATLPELARVLVPGESFESILHHAAQQRLVELPDKLSRADWVRWRLDLFRHELPWLFELTLGDGRCLLVRQGRAADGSTLILMSDITDWKQREAALATAKVEAEQGNRAKSKFLANMSHELRTPLNAIIGFSEILLTEMNGPLGSPVYGDYIRNILSSGEHLLATVSDILDLSLIEAGELSLNEDLESPESLISESLARFREEAHRRCVSMTMLLRSGVPWLRCDGRRISQVLDNLVSNALKFTAPGGVVVVQGRRARSGQLILSVTDNGIGMSAEDIRVALSNFGQVQGVFSRVEGGTGLGLPLCRALVEAHGGTMEIISQQGGGVTVMCRFPASRAVPVSEAQPEPVINGLPSQ